MIYGGGRRARTNWLTTKEFKRINAIFDVLRGGDALLVGNSCSTFCQSATRLSSTRRWVFSSLITFFFLILKRARSPAVDGFFRDHFPNSRPHVRTPPRTRRPPATDRHRRQTATRPPVTSVWKKKDALDSRLAVDIIYLRTYIISTTVTSINLLHAPDGSKFITERRDVYIYIYIYTRRYILYRRDVYY